MNDHINIFKNVYKNYGWEQKRVCTINIFNSNNIKKITAQMHKNTQLQVAKQTSIINFYYLKKCPQLMHNLL